MEYQGIEGSPHQSYARHTHFAAGMLISPFKGGVAYAGRGKDRVIGILYTAAINPKTGMQDQRIEWCVVSIVHLCWPVSSWLEM